MESQKFIPEVGKNTGEDVVEQILSNLPPKALMRFKCVSKNWYARITSPRFVAKHLTNSMNNKFSTSVLSKHLLRKATNSTEETEEVFSLLKFQNDKDNGDLVGCEDIKIPIETKGESLNIIGHCNGIVSLAMANSRKVLLWNPNIQEIKFLPTLPYLPENQPELWCHALGFGYSLKSDDYKVVNVEGYKIC